MHLARKQSTSGVGFSFLSRKGWVDLTNEDQSVKLKSTATEKLQKYFCGHKAALELNAENAIIFQYIDHKCDLS